MNLSLEAGVPVLTVFLQGILSFFSPCVLPLAPLYISYLAGGMQERDEEGRIVYPRKKVLLNTLCFVAGISFAFFLLGFGFTALGRFFGEYRIWFARGGAVIMLLFGFYQLGVFGHSRVVERERRLPFHLERWTMNPLTAVLLGFTFSFAWTPCVGPALASVLLMASSAKTSLTGFVLIGVYVLGFVLPFLAVGMFTGGILSFFRKHQTVIRYTVKISGILLIFMGIMTLTGWMNGITGYLSSAEGNQAGQESQPGQEASAVPAPDFTLLDQNGEEHTLSDYKGQVVFLNFWATWCGPCRQEMPDIQDVYEEYGDNAGDLVVLGVANPKTEERPYNSDVTQEEVTEFLAENGYSYPVVMDLTGEVFRQYGIQAFPTTFMIDREGNVYGYVSGSLTRDMIDSIIRQTFEGGREQEKTEE